MQMNGIKESKKRCDPTLRDFTIYNADPPFTRNASSSPVMTSDDFKNNSYMRTPNM
jgi:hypothetical protein